MCVCVHTHTHTHKFYLLVQKIFKLYFKLNFMSSTRARVHERTNKHKHTHTHIYIYIYIRTLLLLLLLLVILPLLLILILILPLLLQVMKHYNCHLAVGFNTGTVQCTPWWRYNFTETWQSRILNIYMYFCGVFVRIAKENQSKFMSKAIILYKL
jgi:hypothetical protein